jgi:hypothetical protein
MYFLQEFFRSIFRSFWIEPLMKSLEHVSVATNVRPRTRKRAHAGAYKKPLDANMYTKNVSRRVRREPHGGLAVIRKEMRATNPSRLGKGRRNGSR